MVKGKKELYRISVLYYIDKHGGILSVLDEIKQAQYDDKLTKKQAQDLRNVFKRAHKSIRE